MRVAFFTKIRPAEGQNIVDIIKRAHALGYELTPFEGFTAADLGASGNHGPRWDSAQTNGRILREIQDACVVHLSDGDDWPHIMQS
jgi:hypothetical protein